MAEVHLPLEQELIPLPGVDTISVETLPWDSALFGFPVGRMRLRCLAQKTVEAAAQVFSQTSVKLIYADCDQPADLPTPSCLPTALFSAGENVTFAKRLGRDWRDTPSFSGASIRALSKSQPRQGLAQLAVLSGRTSRFRHDPRVPAAVFEQIYGHWLASSLQDQERCTTLVAQEDGCNVAFAIARDEQKFGLVSLISVLPSHQGRGLGRALVRACESLFARRSLPEVRIVTQPVNTAACALYTGLGYAIEQRRHLYHLWPPEGVVSPQDRPR